MPNPYAPPDADGPRFSLRDWLSAWKNHIVGWGFLLLMVVFLIQVYRQQPEQIRDPDEEEYEREMEAYWRESQ
ncbi:MAG: hypothetical protein AAFU85_02160 [Planctomycetota bacterium]